MLKIPQTIFKLKQLNVLPYQQFGQQHFNVTSKDKKEKIDYRLAHAVWSKEQLKNVDLSHVQPKNGGDKFALFFVRSLRIGFDLMSGYKKIFPWQTGYPTERKWVNRILFLETVAGVPGFVAGMHRHLKSLRKMQRDRGWIHTLLEEAENERMHLQTFLEVKQPKILFRTGVMLAQVWYVMLFGLGYFFAPRVCHRIVGYIEEEAVKTYTHCISEINREGSPISHWKTLDAPQLAKEYWKLGEHGTLEETVYAIRKDEEHHKIVNHTFADNQEQEGTNPFPPGY